MFLDLAELSLSWENIVGGSRCGCDPSLEMGVFYDPAILANMEKPLPTVRTTASPPYAVKARAR